jgi:hypothetical protein
MIRLTTLVTATAGREGFAVHCKLDRAEKAARRARGKKGKGANGRYECLQAKSIGFDGRRTPSALFLFHKAWAAMGRMALLLVC